MVAQTRHAAPKKKLQFHDKLLAKGLSTDALLKKMKALHTELAALDQENVDVNSLGAVRKELINTSILLHKDRGVKAYAACCLADILRLYAPDAPYTQPELRDIFQFFFRQLSTGLKGTDSPYYNEYFHLLESLSTVKSVVLICDLPSADEIMAEIFRDFFTLVKRDLAKKIEIFTADILIALIDECQTLPSEVLETILAQFMDENAKVEWPTFRLAVQVCNATADKLQRHVCQYFTDLIVSNSREEEEDMGEIRNAHELIKRLNQSCPGLLHSVIPQLEEELRFENLSLRVLATQVLGEMFAGKGGMDLIRKYPTTWNLWLSRRNDKSAAVRLKFVEALRGLVVNLPEEKDVIEESLMSKIFDPDERVRAAVCKLYGQLDYETALHHVTEDQLHAVAGRALDRKHSVRVEALSSIAKLYSLAYPEIEDNEPLAIKQFSWIPNQIVEAIQGNLEVRTFVEEIVAEYILPLPSSSPSISNSKNVEVDEVAWVDRLLNTMNYLQEKAVNAVLAFTGLKQIRPTIYDHLLDACVKFNGGVIDENEEQVTQRLNILIQHVSGYFPDPQKAKDDLHTFAKLNENRLYKLWKTCMDPQTDIKVLVKATNDFQRRVEQVSASIAPTMNTLLRRCSPRIVNQSSIPTLLKRPQKSNEATQKHARTLLTFASKHAPALYQPHIAELVKGIADEKSTTLAEVCLQALAAAVRWNKDLMPTEKRTVERITRLVMQSDYRHAKFAARILALSKDKDEICTQVVESINEALPHASPEAIVAHISALVQLARFAPVAFESKGDAIVPFLLKEILMVPTLPNSDDIDADEEWMLDEDMPLNLKAKIFALKVCRNRCLAHAGSEKANEIAAPVLKMFATLLEYNGSFEPDANEDPKFISRMRLQAAVSLLHLSTIETYAKALQPRFLKLAVVIQDSCFNVRQLFLSKLISLLQQRKLPPHYNVILFLTVHDPEMEIKNLASAYVNGAMRSLKPALRTQHMELVFIRLLHLLAHHPDFSTNNEDLVDCAKYIRFYLELVASAETVSLLYHLAAKGKTVRDAESHTYSQNFYAICELAQELIKIHAGQHSWNIQSYPGKVRLPSDILRPLPSVEAANQIVKTIYLPDDTLAWLAELLKSSNKAEKKERRSTGKRKAPARTNGNAKRPRVKKDEWRSDEDESMDEPSDPDESADEDRRQSEVDDHPESEPDEGGEGEEELGRGARTRAKARAQRRARAKAKKAATPASDG